MITTQVKVEKFTPQAIEQPLQRAAYKNVSHAAASIRKTMQGKIIRAEGPSAPGTPPHTHSRRKTKRGRPRKPNDVLKNAIVFAADRAKNEAVIGPRHSRVGTSASAHEFGLFYKGHDYDERPFAYPSLLENTDRFGASFAGSMGG